MARITSARRTEIKVWLTQHTKTQLWLSRKLGVSNSTLSEVLSGGRDASDKIVDGLRRVCAIEIDPKHQPLDRPVA